MKITMLEKILSENSLTDEEVIHIRNMRDRLMTQIRESRKGLKNVAYYRLLRLLQNEILEESDLALLTGNSEGVVEK
jgi:hypothetical protein